MQHTDDPDQCAVLTTCVSHCGINIIGLNHDCQVKLHITVGSSQFVYPRNLIEINETLF